MHVILGGAFNGKRQYVIENFTHSPLQFFEGTVPTVADCKDDHIIVIGSFEQMIPNNFEQSEDVLAMSIWAQIQEIAENRHVICICTDMSRGIVPLEKDKRFVRDVCGRLYQKLCAEADEVTRIWYGLPQILKRTKS